MRADPQNELTQLRERVVTLQAALDAARKENAVLRQKVEIGTRLEGRVEIVNGLAPDDVVVTAGAIKLREGAAVTIANAPPSQAPVPVVREDAPKTRG